MNSEFLQDHGPLLLGAGAAVLLLASLRKRGTALPVGMGAAIANSPAPYVGGGATVQPSSAAADAQTQAQLMQQQYQQQILLLNAQTQSQILQQRASASQQQQIIAAQTNAEIQAGHAQMLDNAALINKQSQAKNNIFAGSSGFGILGTAGTAALKYVTGGLL